MSVNITHVKEHKCEQRQTIKWWYIIFYVKWTKFFFLFFNSELAKFEEILKDYKRYKKLLFKLSPPEWQEAQRTKALNAKVPSDSDAQDEQNRESEESAHKNGKCLMKLKPSDSASDRSWVLNSNSNVVQWASGDSKYGEC